VANPQTPAAPARSNQTILTPQWRNTYKLSLGASYQITDPLQLRFGIAYDQSPVRGANTRMSTLPDADRLWLSFGGKYDINQPFSAYVWTIFKNTLKDAFKKNKDLPFSLLDSDDEESERFEEGLIDEEDYEAVLQQDFELEQIQAAMQELDALSREILFLKYIEHKSNTEIEDTLMISQDLIRQRISRALKKLRALLNPDP